MTRTMLLVVTLLVGCATGAVVREAVAPARAQGPAGPTYEYHSVFVREDFTETAKRQQVLNNFGRTGWRLVATESAGDTYHTLHFERQVPAR
jgi:hypothetical protein